MKFIKSLPKRISNNGKEVIDLIMFVCFIVFQEQFIIEAFLLFYELLRKTFNPVFPFSLRRETNESIFQSLERENHKKLQRDKENEELRKIASIG